MKKLKCKLAWAAALLMMGGLASCQSEDVVSQTDENAVTVNAVAHVTIGDNTRTSYTPGDNSFEFAWSTGDKIVVFSQDGNRNLGVMTLSGEGGERYGNFEGMLNVRPNDTRVNIYYLGRQKGSDLDDLTSSTPFNIAEQNTDCASVTDYDVMHAQTDLKRGGDYVEMSFTVESIISIARFRFHLPDGVVAGNEAVTISGTNIYNAYTLNFADAALIDKTEGAITIVPSWNNDEGDAFMTFVPANGAVTAFEVTVGGTLYKAALDPRNYGASKFFCGGKPLEGKDIYFTQGGEWTLIYDANDANDATNVPSPETVRDIFTPSCLFTVIDVTPVREGYRFLGWADTENATAVQYTAGSKVTITRPETSKTIYAVWQEEWHSKPYTLYYGVNGEHKTVTQKYSDELKTPWIFSTDDAPMPQKAGYTLLGWADTENAMEVQYAKTGATIDLTKEIFEKTVYPVWQKNDTEGDITAPGSIGTDY